MFLADSSDTAAGAAALGFSVVFFLIFGIIVLVVSMIPSYMIVKKAGYNGWLCLLQLVPLVNIIMIFVFAFADWPALRGNSTFTGFATPPPPPFPQPGSGDPFGGAPSNNPFGGPPATNPFGAPPPPPSSPFGSPPSLGGSPPPPPPNLGGPPTPWGS